jgi:hypothetical protein
LCDARSPTGLVLDAWRSCVFDAWQGVSTACFPSDSVLRGVPADGAVVAFGDSMSPSPSSTSMVSTLELIMVVSAVTTDLARFLSSSSPSRPGSRLGRRISSPSSTPYAAARQPWMVPYKTWREPLCRSPPSSRRCTRRREETTPPARPPHRGPCSCASPRPLVLSGTSRCPRIAKNKT